MDAFVAKKRSHDESCAGDDAGALEDFDNEPTEVKLAVLASLHPNDEPDALLECLLSCDGSVQAASKQLTRARCGSPPKKRRESVGVTPGYQSSLVGFKSGKEGSVSPTKPLTRKGRTVRLYSPEDIAAHTPCSIIHNFLPREQANKLLEELLDESKTFGCDTFKLFDKVVTSPHTMAFYVHDQEAAELQKTYVYNGKYVDNIRRTPPEMLRVSHTVRDAVNEEIKKRIRSHYPNQQKLKYQSPHDWAPNTAIVNCYDGGKENVGYHSDQLTYLGPRAVIGSLSLGVAREFRVRKVVPRNTQFDPEDTVAKRANEERADTEGQIGIHLPHNSLLVMHAEMQEEWKHSIAAAQAIDPHPIAGNKRINITYRSYRESFNPKYTPRCKCNVPTILRCVQRKQESRGRYIWTCHTAYNPEYKDGCGYFEWAEFDDDGEPPWSSKAKPLTEPGEDPA